MPHGFHLARPLPPGTVKTRSIPAPQILHTTDTFSLTPWRTSVRDWQVGHAYSYSGTSLSLPLAWAAALPPAVAARIAGQEQPEPSPGLRPGERLSG